MSFFFNHHVTPRVNTTDISIITTNPYGLFWSGNPTFIPQKLEIIVGTARTIVMDVKNFITPFKLLEIIETNSMVKEEKPLLKTLSLN